MRVFKLDDSLVVKLPEPLLEQMGIVAGDELTIVDVIERTLVVQKEGQRKAALVSIASLNWTLPPGYKFDRHEANERLALPANSKVSDRARRVTHVSGPWAAPGNERRANASAAYLLMPRELVVRGWQRKLAGGDPELSAFAERLQVNETALIEHLYNLDLIDEMARERMRAEFRIQ